MTKRLKQFEPGHGFSKEDWDAVDNPELTGEELSQMRPARDVLPPGFFRAIDDARRLRGPQKADTKVAVSIRLSRDVVEHFKAGGPGWQTRIDTALKKVVKQG